MKTHLLPSVLFTGCTLAATFSYAGEKRIVVGDYTFPEVLSSALAQGISIPVYLKYTEDASIKQGKSEQKVADAKIVYKNDQLYVEAIDFNGYQQTTTLSPALKDRLQTLDQSFNHSMQIKVNDDSTLNMNLESMYLELAVDRNALATSLIPRSDVLAQATSNEISSILNYRFGYSYNDYDSLSNSSNYLSLDSMSSYKEHHVNLNGSIYGIGTSNVQSNLYRAMYERDFAGRRLAAGMMDTWSMQSIASLSALSTSKIYGFSYGTKSNTVIEDNKQSLTPIVVFLPSAGTVQIYRDGRLLSIQNFSMGSHEIDTSNFPYGIYNVELKTIIDGQETTTTAQVNKSYGRSSSVTGKLDWQLFGGMLEYYKQDQNNNSLYLNTVSKQDTCLMGAALAKNYNVLSGLALRSTFYAFDENAVAEAQTTLSFNPNTNITAQAMLATDSSYLGSIALSYNLPKGYGSVWGSYNKSEQGNKLYFTENHGFDAGLSFNFKQLYERLGFLNVSYSKSLLREYSNTNIEYFQNLFNTRYANISLRTGIQKSTYESQRSDQDKYIFVDVSLPISRWFSAGISSRNSNLLANASYKQNFSNSIINGIGVDVKQVIKRENDYLNQDDFSASAYLSYQTTINSGTLSASASAHSKNFNYTTQGSIASSNFSIGLGNNNFGSGVLINTGLPRGTKMSALINGQDYTLSGNRNFIPLAPYKKYTVELRSDKNSMDSVSIGQGRKNTVVLYPGNVAKIEPDVKQMVTIFGRIRYPDGEIASHVQLNNHIGKTKTDFNGEFSLDVDKKYPVITIVKENGDICESTLSLKEQQGVAWLGEISCIYKAATHGKDNLEARRYD
ncbi:TcfC E-set like domain-containing protein [Acinetobacter sp. SAAs470]|uniref:TcfC E-set like domain-containing protein n=1 Tax=Acinetobacter sp. SAAs470 TaxID=3036709 RepID=UPI0029346AAB|nr:TcfC E-set like domain-containing protein [Acinetobacter sp. SAAs470]WOE30358.1 TcfC E-set like domain-containing protein [Acinetobacter sp. SAAs470]